MSTGHDRTRAQALDAIANALQATVLIAEHLRLAASATTAQDAGAMIRNLRRVTDALERLRRTDDAL